MSDLSFEFERFREAAWEMVGTLTSPHALMKPRIFPDGNMWCALYGENLQEGVAGFGETPAAACADFDKNWHQQKLRGPVASF